MGEKGGREKGSEGWKRKGKGRNLSSHRLPKIVCSRVQSPDTKKIVLMISLSARGLSAKHMGTDRMKGTATVEPNMVK